MQGFDYSCGAATLATLMRYFWGDNVDEPAVLHTIDDFLTKAELKDRVKNGLAIADLRRAAVEMGYLSEVGKITLQRTVPVESPADRGHHRRRLRTFCRGPRRLRRKTSIWPIRCGEIFASGRRCFKPNGRKTPSWSSSRPRCSRRKLSPLTVRQNEVDLGELNNQVIRTMPAKPGSLVTP